MRNLLNAATTWAREIKRDVVVLWIAARDSRTPLLAKIAAAAVAAYALSPIDLIPDFVPILGYLDDLVIVPLGILLVLKLIPAALMGEFRAKAERTEQPQSRAGLTVIIAIWVACAAAFGWLAMRWVWQG